MQSDSSLETADPEGPPPRLPAVGLEPFEWFLAILLALAAAPAVVEMAGIWSTVDYYSHGFLVPLVSLGVVVATREERRGLPRQRSKLGLGVFVGALVVYAFGAGAGLLVVQGAACVAAAAGAVWLARGGAWVRALSFPLGFALFMVPLPASWLAPVIVRLQLFVSEAAVACLHWFDATVAREGNVILLPGGESLFVAEACSGVTSIVTLTPIGVFLAYYTLRTVSARILLVAGVVPMAMLGNLLRVVGTVFAARSMGVEAATQGTIHDTAGLLVYVVACGGLLGLGSILRRVTPGE